MRRFTHALVCWLAFVPWLLGCVFFYAAFGLIYVADCIWPSATFGNCWTFAGARYMRYGGYLLIRPADGQRVLKVLPLLHVIWVHELAEGVQLTQFVPVKRQRGVWAPWHTVYYEGRLRTIERDHGSDWAGPDQT